MDFEFKSADLQKIYCGEQTVKKYPRSVVANFFDIIQSISACDDTSFLKELDYLKYQITKENKQSIYIFDLSNMFILKTIYIYQDNLKKFELIGIDNIGASL